MTYFGYQVLNVALVLAGFASLVFFIYGKNPTARHIESATRAVYGYFALVSFTSIALLYALFTRDFSIEYVAHYSNSSLSWFYTFAAFWAGQAGSMLLWAWLLALFGVIIIRKNRYREPELYPYIMGVMSLTTFFFLYLMVFKTNPLTMLPNPPADGQGLNPLLQNIEMIFHPPSLYIGFVGFTVPFAFALAALITNKLDHSWLKSIRRWTLFSWLFLTIGNILGMQWAYVELGWGGYWAWDPVENSSLLPWLTATAFLHSVVVQERKGMLKKWNIILVSLTFALTIFGTFVTRSGLISSVHAFGVSDLGPLFLGFLALIIIASGILLAKRAKNLTSKRLVSTWTSKESSFMLNNVLFSAITLGVFLGTIMPTISELISGNKMTVDTTYFNRIAVVVGISIFLLAGVCTMLSWGNTTPKRILKNSVLPFVLSLAVIIILIITGMRKALPLFAFFIGFFSLFITLTDFYKSGRTRAKHQNTNFLQALLQLFNKHKRRYGGYTVHLGVLLFFIGIIGSSAFTIENTKTIHKGDTISAGNYTLKFNALTTSENDGMIIDAAEFDILRNDKMIGTIQAEKHIHPNFQPATEVGIRSTVVEDVYVILADYDKIAEIATISLMINPLVIWIWIGGIIMIIGTLVAMSPTLGKKE